MSLMNLSTSDTCACLKRVIFFTSILFSFHFSCQPLTGRPVYFVASRLTSPPLLLLTKRCLVASARVAPSEYGATWLNN